MSAARLAGVTLLLALAPACMSVRYSAQQSLDHGARRGEVHHDWQHSLFFGLVPASVVDLDQYCPETGVLHVKSSVGPLGVLATVFSAGIWTPSHVRVTCADWPRMGVAPPPVGDIETVVIVTEDGTRVSVERVDEGAPLAIPGP